MNETWNGKISQPNKQQLQQQRHNTETLSCDRRLAHTNDLFMHAISERQTLNREQQNREGHQLG